MTFSPSSGIEDIQLRVDGHLRNVLLEDALTLCCIDAETGSLRLDPYHGLSHSNHAAMVKVAAEEASVITDVMPEVSLEPKPSSIETSAEVVLDGERTQLDIRVRRLTNGEIVIDSRVPDLNNRWRRALQLPAVDGVPSLVRGSPSPTKRLVALMIDMDQSERSGELIFVDLVAAHVAYRTRVPSLEVDVGWISESHATFVESSKQGQSLVVRNITTGTLIHTLAQGEQIRTQVPETSATTARYLIAHVRRKETWSCEMFDLCEQNPQRLSLSDAGVRHPMSAVERDGWLTITVDNSFVLASEIEQGPRLDRWELLLPTRDKRHVQRATYDGTTLITHETRDGFLRVVRRRKHRPAQVTPSLHSTLHYASEHPSGGNLVMFGLATAQVEHRHVRAPDGTRIPVTTLFPVDQKPTGIILEVYGGYGVPAPGTAVTEKALSEGYGVVIAHVRGGGDRGTSWAESGTGPTKWNSVTDCVAVVDDLTARYGRECGIAIEGGSHGAWVALQTAYRRPDSVALVCGLVPQVDLFDSQYAATFAPWGYRFDVEREIVRDYCAFDGLPERVPFDILLVAGGRDSRVTWHEAVRFVRRARERSIGPARALVYVEPNHGHMFDSRPARETAVDLMHTAVVQAFARRAS
jgi:protease II